MTARAIFQDRVRPDLVYSRIPSHPKTLLWSILWMAWENHGMIWRIRVISRC